MAIFHLSTKIVSRTSGRTALAAAAYRSGDRLEQDGIDGTVYDYSRKGGVVHTEILAPENAPKWVHDREQLWNDVDRIERQKNSQLAREIEVALPVELDLGQQVALLRTFVTNELVSRGMVADVAVHHDNPKNPHAHILMTMRSVGPEGFGKKERSWNDRAMVRRWRESWASETNRQLALAESTARVDHRSFAEQRLTLIPGRKLGMGVERQTSPHLPGYLANRVAEQDEIRRENGERLLKDPAMVLEALTRMNAAFSPYDLDKYLRAHTDGEGQLEAAREKVLALPALVKVFDAERHRDLYTSTQMVELERGLLDRAERMAQRPGFRVRSSVRDQALGESVLSKEQRAAVERVTRPGYVALLMGAAGTGKSTTLSVAREVFEADGYQVKGAALAGIAAENLQTASGIPSRTIASYLNSWSQGRDPLTARDVLIVDEAGMVGTRQLASVLEEAEKRHAKVILVGDSEQVQPIEAGAPFRALQSLLGSAELREIRRQREAWQRDASSKFFEQDTREALIAYEKRGLVIEHATRDEAKQGLIKAWKRQVERDPSAFRIMVAHTNADAQQLNAAARAWLVEKGHVHGDSATVQTPSGERHFAINDLVRFGRNDNRMDVKNGTLGTVVAAEEDRIIVEVRKGEARETVTVDLNLYRQLDHGYASTVHKTQGSTVDSALVLATPGMERQMTYVAMTRHRDSAELHYGADDFRARNRASSEDPRMTPRDRMLKTLSRDGSKKMAMDYEFVRGDREREGDRGRDDPRPRGALEQMRDLYREREQAEQRQRAASGSRGRSSGVDDAPKDQRERAESNRARSRDGSRKGPERDMSL
jgi:Ti-type conjugative transfer relaxase TraA